MVLKRSKNQAVEMAVALNRRKTQAMKIAVALNSMIIRVIIIIGCEL